MLCKYCGKEMPIAEKFCPYCGRPVERVRVDDETATFTPIRDVPPEPTPPTQPVSPESSEPPIDLSAFDEVLHKEHWGSDIDNDELNDILNDPMFRGDTPREDTRVYHTDHIDHTSPSYETDRPGRYDAPPARRDVYNEWEMSDSEPRTTYFEQSDYDKPYRRTPVFVKILGVLLLLAILGGLAAGGVWYLKQQRPDENLVMAEKYMERGKFAEALDAYEDALENAKDPATVRLQIEHLTSYMQAQMLLDAGEYASALVTLEDLDGRISDKTSKLSEAVAAMMEQAKAAQAENDFSDNMSEVETYLENEEYDAAEGVLDSIAEGEGELSDEQQKKVDQLQAQIQQAQESAQRQEATAQEITEKKQAFSDQMAQMEANDSSRVDEINANIDNSISYNDDDIDDDGAEDPEGSVGGNESDDARTEALLEAASTSFEAWDSLLASMYDYLSTIMSADDYAAEEESYQVWIEDRDAGAQDAAAGSENDLTGQLASAKYRQDSTKNRCYYLLDLM